VISYIPPEFQKTSFNCPHCHVYAAQWWDDTRASGPYGYSLIKGLKIAYCSYCKNYSLWLSEKMIYPEDSGVKPPNPDLPDEIKKDYSEAKSIVNKSPRGAAALLRLCIQKLCIHLGESGENLNNDIANLVKKGLPQKIQQALDIVRVIGNNAVHPGQIDLKDDHKTAMKLFELINLIADVMITQPKEINKMYESLPQTVLDSIKRRDSGTT